MTEVGQSQETQESLLKFPCKFPIKVMGFATESFAQAIGGAVREIVPDFEPSTIKVDYSKTRKYMSLTVTIQAHSKEQLDSVYMMLTSHPMVKIVL